MLRPAADWEIASFLAEASAKGIPVDISGGSTKAEFGVNRTPKTAISTSVLRGIRHYDAAERIITVQAGCPVSEIERELAERGQMLAFEPVDLAPVYGGEPGRTTIGGALASNLAGSRRVVGGAMGTNVVGATAVSGAGLMFRSGGGVSRGTDGFDLKRILMGSWGTLAAIVEVSLRTEWLPEQVRTIVMFGLSEEIAVKAMSDALVTPYDVTGTVHLEPVIASRLADRQLADEGGSVTAVRIEASAAAIDARTSRLMQALQAYGAMAVLDKAASVSVWRQLQLLTILPPTDTPLWRIVTRPSRAFEIVSGIRRYMTVDAFYDWSGGLIWLEVPASADAGATEIRRVIASCGGHATLVRAPEHVKASVDVFEPMRSGVDLVTRRLKQVFDPAGILGQKRLYSQL